MMRFAIRAALAAAVAWPALAQSENPQPERPRAERRARPDGERPRRGGEDDQPGGARRGRGEGGMRMWERLAERLELDETQKAEYDRIMAEYRPKLEALGARRAEIRAAMDSGDTETADRLRAEMESGGGMMGLMQEAIAELEPSLNPDQLARLDQMRSRFGGPGGDRAEFQRILSELPDTLKLDENQRQQLDELVDTRREEMRERMSQMRPIFEEMRAAREAGDEAKVAELEKQMEDARPSREAMLNEFFAQVDDLLTEEQKPLLVTYREALKQRQSAGGEGEADAPQTVRGVIRAAARLQLSGEQRDELKRIQRQASAEVRELPRNDKEGQALLAGQVKDKIAALLDAEQQAEFEKALARGAKRN